MDSHQTNKEKHLHSGEMWEEGCSLYPNKVQVIV